MGKKKYKKFWVGKVFGWSDFGGEKVVGLGCFLSGPIIFQPLQIGEKMEKIMY